MTKDSGHTAPIEAVRNSGRSAWDKALDEEHEARRVQHEAMSAAVRQAQAVRVHYAERALSLHSRCRLFLWLFGW